MYIPNIKALCLKVSEKIFSFHSKSIFNLCDLDMQWTGTNLAIFKEGHIKIIP